MKWREKRGKRGKIDSSLDDVGMTVLVWSLWTGRGVKEELHREGEVHSRKRMRVNKQLYCPNCPSSVASFLVLPSSPVSQQSMAYIYQREQYLQLITRKHLQGNVVVLFI